MEKEVVEKILLYAKKYGKNLMLETANNKKILVEVVRYDDEKVQYKFLKKDTVSSIYRGNINSIDFANAEDKKDFVYYQLMLKYKTVNLKEIIENFKKYYLEIIDQLFSKESKNSIGYVSLKNKKFLYPEMFNKLPNDSDNLLFYYFTHKEVSEKTSDSKEDESNNISGLECEKEESINTSELENQKEVLLIEQANLSQKEAINNALTERVSIIEGPPGTGKTTTILNILANLIYQNKKVLVISKNNSAIDNVADELSKMDIPKCFIRLR